MSETITITVNDRVTGKCPNCRHDDISVIRNKETRNCAGLCIEVEFAIYCKHERVCKLRLEGGEK